MSKVNMNTEMKNFIKEMVSFEAYKEIEELIKSVLEDVGSSYVTYEIITGEPSGDPQDDGFSGGDVYINQSCGISGDDFSGTYLIPLPTQQWLAVNF